MRLKSLSGRRLVMSATGIAALAGVALLVSFNLPNAADTPANPAATSQIIAAARGVVDVDGGLIKISAPRDGVILAVNAGEGAKVKAGDILVQLDNRQELLTEHIAQAELAQAQNQYRLLELKGKVLARKIDHLRKAAVGKTVPEPALEEALDAQASLALELELGSSAANIAQMQLDMAKANREMKSVRATIDGTVIRQNAKVGETASSQAPSELVTIMPNKPKIIRAEIPEEFLGMLAADMHVDIVPENHLSKAFSGTIRQISPILAPPRSTEASDEKSDIRTASAIISVDGNVPLTVGQRVIVKAVE
jgi:multidrug efflux pump subunit AcrA (membrane-fusion protein)